MATNQKHSSFYRAFVWSCIGAGLMLFNQLGWAQQPTYDVEQVRWKSESQVRALLGEPNSIHGPVGTHASYTLWKYDRMTVAFADNRAFHLFDKDSLKKFEIEENR